MNDRTHSKTFPDLLRWRPGEAIGARKANQSVDTLNSIVRGIRGPRQIVGAPKAKSEPGVGGGARKFIILAEHKDYLVGVARAGGDNLRIAKPFDLRWWAFHGQTRGGTRFLYSTALDGSIRRKEINVNDSDDFEWQVIRPKYRTSYPIWAKPLIDNELDEIKDDVGVNVFEDIEWEAEQGPHAWTRHKDQ